ncbi:unnamed protein product [Bursaphelenchus xylophilus]|uniref:(pine wood nematode) hypothetical protein n=1 Tax=Bursaphelenchus xylophilus TaxID=6326 RepID=A0A1I7S5X6_BURXY|nr:unnamed protein product [Bursaphelenchus xylophilus]CAG9082566.1 unnamed protein product [Bursaphelenchus xylophilus]
MFTKTCTACWCSYRDVKLVPDSSSFPISFLVIERRLIGSSAEPFIDIRSRIRGLSEYNSNMHKPKSRETEETTQDQDEVTPQRKTEARRKATAMANKKQAVGRKKRTKNSGGSQMLPVTQDEDLETTLVTNETEDEEVPLEELLKRELAMGAPVKKVVFTFEYENGQYTGIKLNEKMMVVDVDQRPNVSPFWDQLKLGDVVVQINTFPVTTVDEFNQFLQKLPSPMTLHVNRMVTSKNVSKNRQKRLRIDKRTGDRYFTAYIRSINSSRMGITVKSHNGMVAVLRVEDWSPGYGCLEIGDLILDVDGIPVNNVDQTKKLLSTALTTKSFVSCVCCRPMTAKTLVTIKDILGPNAVAPEDPEMKIDAALIGRMEAMRIRARKAKAQRKKGVYRRNPNNNKNEHAVFDPVRNRMVEIWSDVENFSDLQKVPPDHLLTGTERMKRKFKLLFTHFTNK